MGPSTTKSSTRLSNQIPIQQASPNWLSQDQQQSVNGILSSMPVDQETKNRLAGQIFNPLDSQQNESIQSYGDVASKLKDSKYQKMGLQYGTDMPTSSYTG